MEFTSTPKGICPKHMQFELNDGIISNIEFVGGCGGNLRGLALLAEGRPALEVAKMLSGVTCGAKKTSCPDQLAKGIMKALKQSEKKSTKAQAPKNKTQAHSKVVQSSKPQKTKSESATKA